MKKAIALTTVAALLAGCSNIGTVNGVPVGENARVSTQSSQTFCQANPMVCIIGGAVAVGAVGYLASKANGSSGGSGDPCTNPAGCG